MVANESENVKIIIIFKKRLDHGETEGGGGRNMECRSLRLTFFSSGDGEQDRVESVIGL